MNNADNLPAPLNPNFVLDAKRWRCGGSDWGKTQIENCLFDYTKPDFPVLGFGLCATQMWSDGDERMCCLGQYSRPAVEDILRDVALVKQVMRTHTPREIAHAIGGGKPSAPESYFDPILLVYGRDNLPENSKLSTVAMEINDSCRSLRTTKNQLRRVLDVQFYDEGDSIIGKHLRDNWDAIAAVFLKIREDREACGDGHDDDRALDVRERIMLLTVVLRLCGIEMTVINLEEAIEESREAMRKKLQVHLENLISADREGRLKDALTDFDADGLNDATFFRDHEKKYGKPYPGAEWLSEILQTS